MRMDFHIQGSLKRTNPASMRSPFPLEMVVSLLVVVMVRSKKRHLSISYQSNMTAVSIASDLRIHLWDFHQDDVKAPSHTLRGPKGNIFCLNFSATNRYIYSGGTCELIYRYDIGALGTPMAPIIRAGSPGNIYRSHNETIRSITCHPTQDDIFMSASDDGNIIRHDAREDSRLRVSSQNIIQRCSQGIVQRYNTKLTKNSAPRPCNPEASSITFDKDGTRLAVTFLHYLPTIYALSDPNPVAVLSGANLPDGTPNPPNQRTYSNSCTMKHGSFGGPGLDTDNMFASGSDDFRAYIWKIPPLPQLLAKRQEFSEDQWDISHGLGSTIAFTKGNKGPKFIPTEISTPFCRLTGHNSIVNTAVFHPHFLHVVTSGVEKNIILHSSTPSSPCTQNLQPSPANVRQLRVDDADEDREQFLAAMLGVGHSTLGDIGDESERQTLSLFDHILREEGNGDVFSLRQWRAPTSSESESESEDSDCSAELSGEEDHMDSDFDAARPYVSL
ncbi:WD40 repeat-like protein [Pholiota molesta]|nr:WD40 repeat-like protein [Pholiota molesta]